MRSAAAPSIRCPSNLISPRLARIQPAMVLSSVVLPTPLRPNTPTTSPAPHGEVDALHDVAGAVMSVQVRDREHRQACPK